MILACYRSSTNIRRSLRTRDTTQLENNFVCSKINGENKNRKEPKKDLFRPSLRKRKELTEIIGNKKTDPNNVTFRKKKLKFIWTRKKQNDLCISSTRIDQTHIFIFPFYIICASVSNTTTHKLGKQSVCRNHFIC